MGSPIFKSKKLRSRQELDTYMRDVYAGFSTRLHVPLDIPTSELAKKSMVRINVEKKDGYYIARTQRKPGRFAMPHPVFMQRRHKGDKR